MVATTHHGELKVFAHNTEGVTQRLGRVRPRDAGADLPSDDRVPGRSNALAIAKRLGMPESVLTRAGEVVEPERAEFERLLADIQRQRDEAVSSRRAEEIARHEAEDVRQRLEGRLDDVDKERAALAEKARKQLEQEVDQAQAALTRARRTLGEAEQRSLAAAQADVDQAAASVETLRAKSKPRPRRKLPREPVDTAAIAAGDMVYLEGLEQPGEALAPVDERGELPVLLGSLRTRVKASQVTRLEKASGRSGGVSVKLSPPPADAAWELSLRGERVEAALPKLERFLDDAFRSGYPVVRVVHGKGTGAMRQVVREMLAGHPLVRSFETAPPNEGGEGVTLVHLAG